MNNKEIAELILDKEHVRKGKTLEASRGWLKEAIINALKEKDKENYKMCRKHKLPQKFCEECIYAMNWDKKDL